MAEEKKKRVRRTPEQLAAEVDQKIESIKGNISQSQEKIKELEKKKKELLEKKPKNRKYDDHYYEVVSYVAERGGVDTKTADKRMRALMKKGIALSEIEYIYFMDL